MSQVTLSNGQTAEVTRDNYRDLARLDISLQQAKFGTSYDANSQSATLNAFQQLAGLPNDVYSYTDKGASPIFSTAAARVLDNPLVQGADDITWYGGGLASQAGKDAKNAALAVVYGVEDWLKGVGDTLGQLPTAGKYLAYAVGLGAVAFLVWQGEKLYKHLKG